jgi:predicted transposase YbfD/YdcC
MWSSPKGLASRHGWVAIETYGKAKKEWLSTFLELPNGIPSHDTFGRIFSQLEPEILEKNFQEWVKVITAQLGFEVVAIDGKSLNGSDDRENSLKSLVMVSPKGYRSAYAWSSSHRLVLGQVAVEQKSNEIKAIPILLEQLDLKGAIITIDAMGTQTAIAQQIQSAGADYILTLKSNHPTLAQNAYDWWKKTNTRLRIRKQTKPNLFVKQDITVLRNAAFGQFQQTRYLNQPELSSGLDLRV